VEAPHEFYDSDEAERECSSVFQDSGLGTVADSKAEEVPLVQLPVPFDVNTYASEFDRLVIDGVAAREYEKQETMMDALLEFACPNEAQKYKKKYLKKSKINHKYNDPAIFLVELGRHLRGDIKLKYYSIDKMLREYKNAHGSGLRRFWLMQVWHELHFDAAMLSLPSKKSWRKLITQCFPRRWDLCPEPLDSQILYYAFGDCSISLVVPKRAVKWFVNFNHVDTNRPNWEFENVRHFVPDPAFDDFGTAQGADPDDLNKEEEEFSEFESFTTFAPSSETKKEPTFTPFFEKKTNDTTMYHKSVSLEQDVRNFVEGEISMRGNVQTTTTESPHQTWYDFLKGKAANVNKFKNEFLDAVRGYVNLGTKFNDLTEIDWKARVKQYFFMIPGVESIAQLIETLKFQFSFYPMRSKLVLCITAILLCWIMLVYAKLTWPGLVFVFISACTHLVPLFLEATMEATGVTPTSSYNVINHNKSTRVDVKFDHVQLAFAGLNSEQLEKLTNHIKESVLADLQCKPDKHTTQVDHLDKFGNITVYKDPDQEYGTAQAGGEEDTDVPKDPETKESGGFKATLFKLLRMLCGCFDLKLMDYFKKYWSKFVDLCKQLYSVSQGMNAVENIFTKIKRMWEWMLDVIHLYYYGYPRGIDASSLASIFALATNLLARPKEYTLGVFLAVKSECYRICSHAKDTDSKVLTIFSNLHSALEEILPQIQARHFKARKGVVPPFSVVFKGKTGKRKSTYVAAMAQAMSVALSGNKDFNSVHYRNSTLEFWDGYANQLITVWDDWGQMTDDVANPNMSFIELISARNIADYVLPMAQVENKGNFCFTSPILILTTNMEHFGKETVKSIVHPEALISRMDVIFDVVDPGVFKLTRCYGMSDSAIASLSTFSAETITPFCLKVFSKYYSEKCHIIAEVERTFMDSVVDFRFDAFDPKAAELFNAILRVRNVELTPTAKQMVENLVPSIYDDCSAKRLQDMYDTLRINMRGCSTTMLDSLLSALSSTDIHIVPIQPPPDVASLPVEAVDQMMLLEPSVFKRIWRSMKDIFETDDVPIHKCIHNGLGDASCIPHTLSFEKLFPTNKEAGDLNFRLENARAMDFLKSGPEDLKDAQPLEPGFCPFHFIEVAALPFSSFGFGKYSNYLRCKTTMLNGEKVVSNIMCTTIADNGALTAIANEFSVNKSIDQRLTAYKSIMNHAIEREQSYKTRLIKWFEPKKSWVFKLLGTVGALLGVAGIGYWLYDFSNKHFNNDGHAQSKQYTPKSLKTRTVQGIGKAQSQRVVENTLLTDPNFENMWVNPVDRKADNTARDLAFKVVYHQAMIVRERKNVTLNDALMMDTRTFLTTRHTLEWFRPDDYIMLRFPHRGVTFDNWKVRFGDCEVVDVPGAQGDRLTDAVFVRFPERYQIPGLVSLWDKFVPYDHLPMFENRRATLIGVVKYKGEVYPSLLDQQAITIAYTRTGYRMKVEEGPEHSIEIPEYIHYEFIGHAGACGTVLVGQSPMATCPGRILGIHSAQSANKSRGLAVVLTQEQVHACRDKLDRKGAAFAVAQCAGYVGPYAINQNLIIFDKSEQAPDLHFLPDYIPKHQNTRSHIVLSKIGEQGVIPCKKAPAILKTVVVDGVAHDPNYIALKKFEHEIHDVDPNILEHCVEDYSALVNASPIPSEPRILSLHEAVFGIEGDRYLKAIKMSTSPGYPWKNVCPGMKGKYGLIKLPDPETHFPGWIHPELVASVERLIDSYERHELPSVIFEDHLKDEKRPVEKVKNFKTRLFSAAPLDLTIVMRMYFGAFISHMMHNHVYNEQGVGINPTGPGWTVLAHTLLKYGDRIIAGDFSNIDGTEIRAILWAVMTVVNNWYGAVSLVRVGCWHSVISSTHLNSGWLYILYACNPSGNLMTAFINGTYLCVAFRYIFYKKLLEQGGDPTVETFRKHVSLCVFGDDNIMGVSSTVAAWFNPAVLAAEFAKIGMTYTSEDKSEVSADFRKLENCSFLKRSFYYDPDERMYLGRLDLDTILEIVNWTYDDVTADELKMGVEQAIRELALYDRNTYQRYTRLILKAAQRAHYSHINISSQFMYRHSMLRDDAGPCDMSDFY